MSATKRRAVPEKRHKLNVPCIAWIYSQAPKPTLEHPLEQELKAPIIIWWIEPMLPSKTKRKLYFSYLDEKNAPLRSNLSEAIKHTNAEFRDLGFNINCTNTYRYVYAVPKIQDESGPPGTAQHFAGYNLWANYDKTSYIPSYIADPVRLAAQRLLPPGAVAGSDAAASGNLLSEEKGTRDEQLLYRNMVISACQPLENPELGPEAGDPTCTTTAVEEPLEHKPLEDIATMLLWKLDVFLQFVADNTFRNFQRAGYGGRLMQQAVKELRLVELILFAEKNYKLNRNGTLVSPPFVPGVERSRRPIDGLRLPSMPLPWTGVAL